MNLMKRTLLIFIILITTTMVKAQQTQAQRDRLVEKKGIRNVKLGTNIKDFNNLELIRSGTIRHYRKRNEDLVLGDIKVKSIEYEFFEGKLIAFSVYFDPIQYNSFYSAFLGNYGSPTVENSVCYWLSNGISLNLNKNYFNFFLIVDKLNAISVENKKLKDDL